MRCHTVKPAFWSHNAAIMRIEVQLAAALNFATAARRWIVGVVDMKSLGKSVMEGMPTSAAIGRRLCAVLALLLPLSGCTSGLVGANVATGPKAYDQFPAAKGSATAQAYFIGPLDRLDVAVFQEPDVSIKGALVDAGGNISMPLIGGTMAAGKTAEQLGDIIEQKLARYYVNPQVTVSIINSVSQRITVEGEVTEPGIYQMNGPTTLLDALALAKGETENAAMRQVAVIRFTNGVRTGAVFDLQRIRRGDDKDPEIFAKDAIIVGHSNGKQLWHDLLKAAPLLNAFAQF